MSSRYGFGTTVQVPYEEAIQRVKDALKTEGFGVLAEIDVRQTLREKLGAEMEPYLILGAATRSWRTGHLRWSRRSGCFCLATSWYAPSVTAAASR